jgi:hypothetical protein
MDYFALLAKNRQSYTLHHRLRLHCGDAQYFRPSELKSHASVTMPANIELVSATADQEPILANLLELYMHDFSEFLDLDL